MDSVYSDCVRLDGVRSAESVAQRRFTLSRSSVEFVAGLAQLRKHLLNIALNHSNTKEESLQIRD